MYDHAAAGTDRTRFEPRCGPLLWTTAVFRKAAGSKSLICGGKLEFGWGTRIRTWTTERGPVAAGQGAVWRCAFWAYVRSDKSEKTLRFNSDSSRLLSECALKVFSRRNPSKLNTLARRNHSSNGHHQRMSVSVVEPFATFSCSRTCVRIYSS